MDKFDVTVIGSGPGGYVCAIRCAQLGMKTAIIERYSTLGGTCLNVGCIPSKAFLDSSERFHDITTNGEVHGIEGEVKLNLPKMVDRVKNVVDQNVKGIAHLMKKNDIQVIHGHGTIQDKNTIKVAGDDGEREIKTDKIVIATGSKPSTLPGIEIDKERIITSTEALWLTDLPDHMICIGGGIIGLELGSVFARLGTKVTVIEYFDSIIFNMDRECGKGLQRAMKKHLKVKFNMSHKVTSVERDGDTVTVKAENKKGEEVIFEGDMCLVSVGRRPYTDNLGLENLGIETEKGKIPVNDHLQTDVDGVFAIGDVVRGPMLAHKAEEDGVYVAEYMAGQKPHLNYHLIPSVVYTWPEVAGVGYTEEQLKEKETPYKKGSFSFKASGRARASNENDGFIKVLAHEKTDEILGVHMVGPRVADIIAEAVLAMEYKATAEDVARVCHAHPTYTEALKEACLAATDDRALHS